MFDSGRYWGNGELQKAMDINHLGAPVCWAQKMQWSCVEPPAALNPSEAGWKKEHKSMHGRTTRGWIITALVAASMVVGANQASANSIRLSADFGASWTEVGDGDGDGIVQFNGTVGTFTVNLTTGISKPELGSASSPRMELSSIQASSSGSGTLWIQHSDTDFTQLGSARASFTINELTAGSGVDYYRTYWSATNTLWATTNLMTDQGPFGPYPGDPPGAFPQVQIAPGPTSGPYSLTQTISLTHSGAATSSLRAVVTVPDGGSAAALLGSALLAFGFLRARLRKN